MCRGCGGTAGQQPVGSLEEERAEGWRSSAETVSQVADEGGAVRGKNPEELWDGADTDLGKAL